MARIVVIGAGIGGMAVAARLRVKGHDVTVVEAAPTHGGALSAWRRDGFTFDLAPGLFTLPAVYRDLFLKTGDALEADVELVPLDPAVRHHFADGALTVPGVGVGRTAEAMGTAFGAQAADDWRTLMSRAGQIWATIRRPVLETALTSSRDQTPPPPDRATRRILAPRRALAQRRTLHGLGRRQLHDPRVRQVLDHYATHSGADPRRAPASLVTQPYIEATFGAWHIAGGLASLGDALRTRLDDRGVTVLLNTQARRILTTDGRVSGVLIERGEPPAQLRSTNPATPPAGERVLPADIVVTDIDPVTIRGLLGPDPRPAPPRPSRHSQPTPSAGAFQVLMAVRGSTQGIGHTTVWHPERPDHELEAVFARHPRPAPHPTIRAVVPDDPAMRPAGHEAWTLQVTAPRHSPAGREPGTVDWDARGLAQRYADDLLRELVSRGGPALNNRILWRELRTPADHERRTGSPGGATHGMSSGPHTAPQHAPNAASIPGLFHVGASAHPGPGLPLVGLSAELVANLIGRARSAGLAARPRDPVAPSRPAGH